MADFLEGDVKVPGIGKSKKWAVYGIGGAAGVYVGYRWWKSRQDASAAPAADTGLYTTDLTGMGDSATGGAMNVTGNTGNTTTDGTNPNAIDTNAEWTQQAAEILAEAGYDPPTVYEALGAFLARQTLTTAQAAIARAALAAAGQPPVNGPFTVKDQASSGGTSSGTLNAPTGLHVISVTDNSVTLGWNKMDGVDDYLIYRNGVGPNVGAADKEDTSITIGGLEQNTTYSFTIRGDTTGQPPGKPSSPVTTKTRAVTVKAPTGIRVTGIGKTTATVSWTRVPGAQYYRIYINGVAHGAADGGLSSYLVQGLSSRHHYTAAVAADTTNQLPGPQSSKVSFTTK